MVQASILCLIPLGLAAALGRADRKTARANIRVAWFVVTSSVRNWPGLLIVLRLINQRVSTKTVRGGRLVLGLAFRQQNDDHLVICSLYSRLLLDSITSHFDRSLRSHHRLSCSRLALP